MMEKDVTLDEVLDKFSIFGRHHLKFFFLVSFSYALNTLDAYQFVFVAEKSEYKCRDEGFSSVTCSSVNGTSCSGWIYDDPHSFVAEFDLACQEWKRTLVGTTHSVGYMFGLIFSGLMADRFGRKPVIVLMGVMEGILGLAKSYTYSYWLYIAFELIGATIGDSYLTFFILNMEVVSSRNRVTFSCMCFIVVGFANITVPLAAWGISYWRNFLRTIYMPCFFTIVYIFLLDESPRWLLIKGKKDKTVALIEKIIATNKVKLDLDLNKLAMEDQEERVGFRKLMLITFGSRTLVKRSLISLIWWTTCIFVGYGMAINSVNLEGNKYINYALVEGINLPANFLVMYIMNRFTRKYPLICCYFTSAAMCLIHPLLPEGYLWISLTIYMFGKMMGVLCFGIIYIYTSELFPTYTRNSMQGFCSSVGRIGSIVAPLTPLLMMYWEGIPSLLFGGTSIIAGLLTFLVPDTTNNNLPDTVKEAEVIGKKPQDMGITNLAMSEEAIAAENL